MNLKNIPIRDWRLIHSHVVWLVAAMLFTGVALLLSQGYLQYNQRQLAPLQKQLREVRDAADAAQIALNAAQDSQQRYAELTQRGAIGNQEHRLDWVESFTALKKDDPALKFSFKIDAQRQLEHTQPVGSSALYASVMNVKYEARHEGQFSFLHHRIQQLPGWAAPLKCEMQRAAQTDAIEGHAPNMVSRLLIDCDYEWLSIAPVPAAKVEEE